MSHSHEKGRRNEIRSTQKFYYMKCHKKRYEKSHYKDTRRRKYLKY